MIEHMDNWAVYGVGGQDRMLDGVYAELIGNGFQRSIVADPDITQTGLAFASSTSGFIPGGFRYILASGGQDKVGVAQRLWIPSIPTTGGARPVVVQWSNAANVAIASVSITPIGGVRITSGDPFGTVVAQNSVPVITPNAWWHWECSLDSSTGAIEIRVEGVPVLTHTITPPGTQIFQFDCYNASDNTSGASSYIKDFVVWNGSGSHNTNFLGSVLVYSLLPSSDTSFPWTSTAANGWSVLDNAPPLDDVAYITAINPPPAPATFGLTDLPANVTSVRGLMSQIRAKKVDGGDGNLQTSLVSGASTAAGANRPITAAYAYWRDVFEVDPATSNSWTIAAANAAILKLNRTV